MPWPILIAAAAVSLLLGKLIPGFNSHLTMLAVAGITVAGLTFFSPKIGLGILVFSMLLSPEIGIGAVGYRDVVIRYDDILVMIVFFAWFARTAIFKEKAFIAFTPVNMPIFIYTSIFVISTALGIMEDRLSYKESSFYVLKYIEYFMLFFMVVNIVTDAEDVKGYLVCGLITALVVLVYGIVMYAVFEKGFRVALPFESKLGEKSWGEPATAGGYYLILMGMLLGFYTQLKGWFSRFSMVLFIVTVPVFLLTLSRASYASFAVLVLAGIILTKRKKMNLIMLTIGLVIGGSFLSPFLGNIVKERVLFTFVGQRAPQSFNIAPGMSLTLESSSAARVRAWQRIIFEKFPQKPFLGWGTPGVGLVDSQIPLVLGETGLIGLAAFFWMLYRVWFVGRYVHKKAQNDVDAALGFSLTIIVLALIMQTFGVNTFIIVRVMEPFWFIAALVAVRYSKYKAAEVTAQAVV